MYSVLCEIWVECNKVSDMKLFNVTLLKPMRLEEFKNTQSQMQLQVRQQISFFSTSYLTEVTLSEKVGILVKFISNVCYN